jgi:hypothetical protein
MDHPDKVKYNPEELVCRPATAEDFEGVMNINRHVYVKFDYLYGKYMEYYRDPAFKQFVAVYKDLIVSYYCVVWVKKDEVLWTLSIRTMPSFQNLGIIKYLRDYILQYLDFKLPCLRYSKRYLEGFIPKSNKNILMKWNMIGYNISVNDIKRNIHKMKDKLDKPIPYDTHLNDIVHMLQNPECIEEFKKYEPLLHYPGNDWIFYEITRENVVKMVKSYPTFVTMNVKENRIEAISNFSSCPQLGGSLSVEFFYMGQPDISLWKSHVTKCVLRFLEGIKDGIILPLVIHFPDAICRNEAEKFLKPIFGEEFTDFVFKQSVVLDEYL